MADKALYSYDNVTITGYKAVFGDREYSLLDIRFVKLTRKIRLWQYLAVAITDIIIIVPLYLLNISYSSPLNVVRWLVTWLIAGLASYLIYRINITYVLTVKDRWGKKREVLISKNREHVLNIASALSQTYWVKVEKALFL